MSKMPSQTPLLSFLSFRHKPILAGLLVLGIATISGAQEDELTVQLASGRTRQGFADQRTTEEMLWIRTQVKNSYLLRPVPWSQIARVMLGDQTLSKDDVLARVTPTPPDQPRQPPIRSNTETSFLPRGLATPTAVTLSLRAEVGNWDQDAQPDGLVLWLRPEDASGEFVPAVGQVEVECWGLERRHGKPGGELVLVERWSLPIGPANSRFDGVRLNLPFGAINPVERLDFNRWGLVKVRFSIPGNSVLDAELDGVCLKPSTRARDWQRISDLFPR